MGLEWDQFCSQILKIDTTVKDEKQIVYDTVKKELDLIYQYTDDLEGLCKIVGTNIYQSLVAQGILVRQVNVQDYFGECGKDHLFLIAYMNDEKSPFLLIDPTFRQFCSREGCTVLPPLTCFPDQYLRLAQPALLHNLMGRGVIEIDDDTYQIYLASLVAHNVVDHSICLNDVLLKSNDRRR